MFSVLWNWETLGRHARAMNASGNIHPENMLTRFIETDVDVRKNSLRKALAKVESNLEIWGHEKYHYY